jgi:hypothetical protein
LKISGKWEEDEVGTGSSSVPVGTRDYGKWAGGSFKDLGIHKKNSRLHGFPGSFFIFILSCRSKYSDRGHVHDTEAAPICTASPASISFNNHAAYTQECIISHIYLM